VDEHARAVALAATLLGAGPETAPAALAALRAFLHADGLAHFTVEELVLLRALLSADPESRLWADRLLYEHDTIRIRLETLAERERASPDELREVGRLLLENVRGEEEELFPHLEATLDVSELGPAIAGHLRPGAAPPR
jgi:hypothetical protein